MVEDMRQRMKYLWLLGINLFISSFTFGGGYVVVPMIRKYYVEKKGLFSEEELMEMAAIAQSSPGAIAINLSGLAGYRVGGVPGAAISCLAAVIPPLVILSAISLWYSARAESIAISITHSVCVRMVCIRTPSITVSSKDSRIPVTRDR